VTAERLLGHLGQRQADLPDPLYRITLPHASDASCAGPGGTTPLEPPAALRAPQWYFAETPAAHRTQGPVRWAGMSVSP